jgi:hypothetical protein
MINPLHTTKNKVTLSAYHINLWASGIGAFFQKPSRLRIAGGMWGNVRYAHKLDGTSFHLKTNT